MLFGIASIVSAALLSTLDPKVSCSADAPVIVRQETIVIPTYLPGAPERNPMFYFGRAYQGAKGVEKSSLADLLDFWAANELRMVMSARSLEKVSDELAAGTEFMMRDALENYLELSSDYAACRLYAEAATVLSRRVNGTPAEVSCPMLHYDLAFYYHKSGDESGADQHLQMAMTMPPDYGFPFRLEDSAVLRWAESRNPQDARAPYYLGNPLFDRQPEAAIAEWEKAIALDGTLATALESMGDKEKSRNAFLAQSWAISRSSRWRCSASARARTSKSFFRE